MSPATRKAFTSDLAPLLTSSASPSSSPHLIGISDIRARRAGSLIYVDLTAQVTETLTIADSAVLEDSIIQMLQKERKEVAEVRVKFVPASISAPS